MVTFCASGTWLARHRPAAAADTLVSKRPCCRRPSSGTRTTSRRTTVYCKPAAGLGSQEARPAVEASPRSTSGESSDDSSTAQKVTPSLGSSQTLTHTGCQLDRPRLWDGVLMSLPVDHRHLAELFRQFRYLGKPCLDTACAARRSIRMHHTMHRMLSSQFFRSERPHATLLHSKHELRMSWLSGSEALCLHIDSARPGPKSGRRPPATGKASLDRGMSGVRVTGGAERQVVVAASHTTQSKLPA